MTGASIERTRAGLWTPGLLIRRNIADGDLAFFSTWCPAGTGIAILVTVKGHRWAIEDSFETAKNELRLDHNETHSWHGWHRHVSLVMLAFAMTAAPRDGRRAWGHDKRHPPGYAISATGAGIGPPTTFIAALRCDSVTAPMVLDGAMSGAALLEYVHQILVPTLRPPGCGHHG